MYKGEQKGFSHILVLILVLAGLGTGFLIYSNTKSSTTQGDKTPKLETLLYRNDEEGFEFEYENGGGILYDGDSKLAPSSYMVKVVYKDGIDFELYYVTLSKGSTCLSEVKENPANATFKDITIAGSTGVLREQNGAYEHFYKTACLDSSLGAFVFSTEYPLKATEEEKQTSERRFEKIINSFKFTENNASSVDTVDNMEYANSKYGFKIEYPASLGITSSEDYDVQARQREYHRKCKSGEIQGCGGLREPEYQIRFLNSAEQIIFTVDIHVTPSASYYGEENNGFTYVVDYSDVYDPLAPEITPELLEDIRESLSFIPTERPIQCLWTGEFMNIDVEGLDQSQYKQSSGFYYDQEDKKCDSVSLWSWRDSDLNIPFENMEKCITTCSE